MPPVRERILECVLMQPGLSKSELQRDLGLGWGTIHHHLGHLESLGQVVSRPHRGQRHVFPAGVAPVMQRLLAEMRDPQKAALTELLQEVETLSCAEAANLLDLPFKAVQRRLADLAKQGILVRRGTYRPQYSLAASSLEPHGPRSLQRFKQVAPTHGERGGAEASPDPQWMLHVWKHLGPTLKQNE